MATDSQETAQSANARFIPPTAHESMRRQIPDLDKLIPAVASWVRRQPDWDERRAMTREESQRCPGIELFLEARAATSHLEYGDPQDEAIHSANFLGMQLFYYVNFELHRRKIFWVDESLAWMLARTQLDIEGEYLKLPFPCCAFVFTDPETLGLCETLKQKDDDPTTRREPLKILTVYAVDGGPKADGRALYLAFLLDHVGEGWPYFVTRDLLVRPRDRLEAILESHFPEVDLANLDPFFSASELKRLIHLVLNAVLYATTAHLDAKIIRSPLAGMLRAASRKGKAKAKKALRRVEREALGTSSEDVYFLPGKIEISRLRELSRLERQPTGRTLMARFMVRGHWRAANPSWKDQNLRWIEPYWKGPEIAAVVEREYKLKP